MDKAAKKNALALKKSVSEGHRLRDKLQKAEMSQWQLNMTMEKSKVAN